MHWKTGNLISNDIDSDDSDMSTDRIPNQDISSDDESSTNESVSDSNDDTIPVIKKSKASTSTSDGPSQQNNDNDDEDSINSDADEVVQAILHAKELHRNHPPSITLEDMITDICFHPKLDTIGVASITGDVFMYKYNNEETNLVSTIELHLKACRDIEFSEDGQLLFSTGKDLCIAITNVETEQLVRLYDKAHEQPIYTMTIISEHVFVTGDDNGVVKLWDLRQKGSVPIFSIKDAEDYISAMITNTDAKYLACASGDCLTTINIPERKLHVQSEEHDDELTCLGLFKMESKLLTASNKGKMYVYNWGEFGLHSDEFPSIKKKAINCMIPITENVVITGEEDGIVRATSLFPHHHLGIVGQHNFSVETLDISNDGILIASSSHDNDIKFWNVQYFETLNVTESKKGEKRKWLEHNLPSSKIHNRSDFFAEL
ncbi:PREDICTED: WD repeat-containing protein 55 homolog isoform X2 [Acromyrmex echinatior]|uniref:WD repeat-containing protein 55 homolog n=1 Tax=Acromyrmex echinatior TaxID=103372 RepID=F4WRU3_ACREC|nr:PREDICTED: WD repeat-containing protein 55 homolog isoform X2 [Acromyrmex echinatior]EGI63100.1 WD repeat-containing protein 55-like protein [Acromyrmex echinatior]